jgi:hypothetical protein
MNAHQPPMPDDRDLFKRLEELNSIGVALSKERTSQAAGEDPGRGQDITNADGGTLYRMTTKRATASSRSCAPTRSSIAMGGTTGVDIPFYPIHLYRRDGSRTTRWSSPIRGAARPHGQHRRRLHRRGFDFSGTKNFDKKTGYRSKSFLTVPMKNHEDEIIGVLQLINAKDRAPGRSCRSRRPTSARRVARLAGGDRAHQPAADQPAREPVRVVHQPDQHRDRRQVALHRRPLRARAGAHHDAGRGGEPHPHGAAARLPHDERDRYELKIAGLLHDCGKVTTPVHVVDKATKLQTIFDRID